MSFLLFLVGFLEKWTKREKFGQLRGSFATAKRPLAAAKVLVVTKDHHTAARPREKVGPASGSGRRSYYSQHEKCYVLVLFCYSVAPRNRLLD